MPKLNLIRLRKLAEKALEQAREYSLQGLPHLADISGWTKQVDHAVHFAKRADDNLNTKGK